MKFLTVLAASALAFGACTHVREATSDAVAWVRDALQTSVDAPLDRTVKATTKALKNLQFAEIATKADRLVELHKAFATMFPPGSDNGDTLAAPAIWSDRAGFDAINNKTVDAATKMAAAARANDLAAVGEQFKAMAATCGERIVQIVRYLHSRGVLTKVRNSAGQDIDGGCGQLRARAERRIKTRQLD